MKFWCPISGVSGRTRYRPAAIPGTIPDGRRKVQGIRMGQTVAIESWPCEATTARMQADSLCFGTAPGDYQSTLRIFRRSPIHALVSRGPVRAGACEPVPAGLPGAASDSYGDAFNQIKSLGIVNSTTATAMRQ